MNALTHLPEMNTALNLAQNLPAYDARGLTKNGPQAVIQLDGQTYFLRITRAGKLILTK